MLLGGLMERSLAKSPNIVWGAGEETYMKTTESHMVLANGQQAKIQKQRTERTLQSYRAMCFSYSLSYFGTSLEVLK